MGCFEWGYVDGMITATYDFVSHPRVIFKTPTTSGMPGKAKEPGMGIDEQTMLALEQIEKRLEEAGG